MPPRYLIIKDGDDGEYDADYADYLLEIEYRKDASTLKKIPPPKHKHDEWDDYRPPVPPGFRIGKDTL